MYNESTYSLCHLLQVSSTWLHLTHNLGVFLFVPLQRRSIRSPMQNHLLRNLDRNKYVRYLPRTDFIYETGTDKRTYCSHLYLFMRGNLVVGRRLWALDSNRSLPLK